jgi:hypothetical protein
MSKEYRTFHVYATSSLAVGIYAKPDTFSNTQCLSSAILLHIKTHEINKFIKLMNTHVNK